MTKAFLSLWNNYPIAFADEYEVWHTFEHVPERLTPPGIRTARRYVSTADGEFNRYFTLYDLDDLETIQHPTYLDLVRNPTRWSEKMRRHFSEVLRIPAECVASGGRGMGAHALVQAYSVERDAAAASAARLGTVLQDMVEAGQILTFRIGLAEPNQKYEVFEQEPQTEAGTLNVVILAESTNRSGLEKVRPAIVRASVDVLQPRSSLRDGLYELLASFDDADAPASRSQILAGETMTSRFTETC